MKSVKNIAILGSTGSIGRNSLDVIDRFPERFHVQYLTANRNSALLLEQVRKYRPAAIVIGHESSARELRSSLNGSTEVLHGDGALEEIVGRADVDLVISALVGFAGLSPTLRAIEARKDIALANKETLVVGGELVMDTVHRAGVRLLPVDSEHSAILQCLQGEQAREVHRIILTASGGPFLGLAREAFSRITVREALNHPTWRMGKKITIDSATLMNKGLEVIEARWLFDLPLEKIDVVIHPQSIIHSMVEFADGSIKAQLGLPDMKLPIQYALTFPERTTCSTKRLRFADVGTMTFQAPDPDRFPCLPLAYRALTMGGSATAVLNAANETAVALFLDDRIGFTDIPALIGSALDAHSPIFHPSLDDLIRIDRDTRETVSSIVKESA